MTSRNLVLRTMYIDPEIDDMLRNEAFDLHTSKNDLLRKYLSMGIEAARKAGNVALAAEKPATKKRATTSAIKQASAAKKSTAPTAARKAPGATAAKTRNPAVKAAA